MNGSQLDLVRAGPWPEGDWASPGPLWLQLEMPELTPPSRCTALVGRAQRNFVLAEMTI